MDRHRQTQLIVHADRFIPTQIAIELQSFFEFQFWLAEELEALVARYQASDALPAKVRGNKRPNPSAPASSSLS